MVSSNAFIPNEGANGCVSGASSDLSVNSVRVHRTTQSCMPSLSAPSSPFPFGYGSVGTLPPGFGM